MKKIRIISKGILLLSAMMCFLKIVNAQNKMTSLDTFLYNKVYKNIAAYNIKHAQFSTNGAIDNSPFYITTNFFYEAFLPDLDSRLIMDIKKSDLVYVDPRYQLYEVSLDGLIFQEKDSKKKISGVSPGRFFLVAKKNNDEMKFISGQFFQSAIFDDFKADLKNPGSLIKYLEFKTWCYRVNSIKFINHNRKRLYFSGYSDLFKKDVKITLNEDYIEYPQITW